MEPEEIEAMIRGPEPFRQKKQLPNPLRGFRDWYDQLDDWDRRSLQGSCELVGFMSIPLLFFLVVGLTTNGLPGQYRGAYKWAGIQDTPTKIEFCQSYDFGVRRCRYYDKSGNYGYIQSDNGGRWENILED